MSTLAQIRLKIVGWQELTNQLQILRKKNRTVVFTNGCFDIIHRGHIEYLTQASELGDVLVIGLNSDDSVARIKGDTRPLQDHYSRSIVLASLTFVDFVVLFSEDTPYELIKLVQPDYLVKGGDYQPKDIVGYDIVTNRGGTVLGIPVVPGYSTSSIIKKIRGK